MTESELLTVAEVAEALSVTEETIRRWLRTGDIHGINLGRRGGINLGRRGGWRVRTEELARFLKERER